MKMWVGKEKEGKFKGLLTLFVGSPSMKFKHINKIVKCNNEIKQIYFGAGGCTPINWNLVHKCQRELHNFVIVTIELPLNKFNGQITKTMKKLYNFILTIDNRCIENLDLAYKYRYQIKLQSLKNKKVIMLAEVAKLQHIDCNRLQGMTYEGDKVLI